MSQREGTVSVTFEGSDEQHVVPEFGRAHDVEGTCWCEPRRDVSDRRIVIHNFREVA